MYYIRLLIKILNITHINIIPFKKFLWLKNPSCKLMTAALRAVGVGENDSRHGIFNLTIHQFYSSANPIKVITIRHIHLLHSTLASGTATWLLEYFTTAILALSIERFETGKRLNLN